MAPLTDKVAIVTGSGAWYWTRDSRKIRTLRVRQLWLTGASNQDKALEVVRNIEFLGKVMKLEGKVALVTGSSQGIGQAIAIRLASEGADIIIDYRSHADGAEETKAKVEATGRKGLVVKADLGIVSDVKKMVAESIYNFGKLDILVNNAGMEKNASFWDVTEEDYDNVLNVNFKGVFFGAINTPINKSLLEDFEKRACCNQKYSSRKVRRTK